MSENNYFFHKNTCSVLSLNCNIMNFFMVFYKWVICLPFIYKSYSRIFLKNITWNFLLARFPPSPKNPDHCLRFYIRIESRFVIFQISCKKTQNLQFFDTFLGEALFGLEYSVFPFFSFFIRKFQSLHFWDYFSISLFGMKLFLKAVGWFWAN